MRDLFYDRARGIGMFLLVLGHVFPKESNVFAAIFSFHMPLFFLISGMLLNQHKERGLKDIFSKTSISYSFFLIVGLCLLFIRILIGDFTLYRGGRNFIVECIYNIGPDAGMVGSIWFLPILGISQIMALWLYKMKTKNFVKYRFYDVGVLALLAIASMYLIAFLPGVFRIRTIFTTTLFVYAGLNWSHFIKKRIDAVHHKRLCLFLIIPFWFYISLLNGNVNIASPVYNNYFLFVLGALSGIVMVFLLSKFDFMNFSTFWGKNSLIIFATHGIWLYVFRKIWSYFNFAFPMPSDCFYLLVSLSIILLCIPTYYFFRPLLAVYKTKMMKLR